MNRWLLLKAYFSEGAFLQTFNFFGGSTHFMETLLDWKLYIHYIHTYLRENSRKLENKTKKLECKTKKLKTVLHALPHVYLPLTIWRDIARSLVAIVTVSFKSVLSWQERAGLVLSTSWLLTTSLGSGIYSLHYILPSPIGYFHPIRGPTL